MSTRTRLAVVAAMVLAGSMLAGCGQGSTHVIDYDVLEATLSGGPELPVAQIEYTFQTGGRSGPTRGDSVYAGTTLPWHLRVTAHGDLYLLDLLANLNVPDVSADVLPTVQCQITVDGKIVLTQTGLGTATCEANAALIQQKLG